MKNNILILICMMTFFTMMSQEKKGVIKTDISGINDYNFYQLAYEFNIKEKNSFEVGIGFGSENGINIYGLSIQGRYYLNKISNTTAPAGFHVGPRVLAVYAESNESTIRGVKENAFSFEIDGIIGYQFIIGNIITFDPYIGGGIAIVENQTVTGFVWGVTLGVAF
ncbi:MAG: hypothetical protein IMY67_07715 [Bacteroidetes bacterium]|nr:hypothetical protein [Bacteroidota bacterium]